MSATWDSKDEKTTPASLDEVLLIDTEDSRNQKRATLSNIGVGIWSRNATSGLIFPTTLTDFVGIGTITPLALLNPLSTSEQLRLSYDASNFTSFTTSSAGDLTIAPTGENTNITGDLNISNSNNLNLNGGLLELHHGGSNGFITNSAGGLSISNSSSANLFLTTNGGDIVLTGGNAGIGLSTLISAKLHILETTEQLRLAFDASNYASFTVSLADAGFNLSAASYDSISFGVGGQDTTPTGMAFNSDGSRMYVVGNTNNTIYQYDLSTNFDISSAVYNSISFDVSSQDTTPTGMAFNSDGSRMYVVGDTNNTVYQYDLSTNFDISSAVYNSISFGVGGQETSPQDVLFNSDGSRMYVVGANTATVYQYDLSTNFDISSAVYNSISFDVGGQEGIPTGVAFNSDGTKMYIVGVTADTVFQYSLTTGFNVSTASYDSIFFGVGGQETSPQDVLFNSDGTKMYIVGIINNTVFQYSLSAGGLTIASIGGGETTITGNTTISGGDLNLTTGGTYQISGTSVLSATTLGSTVVSSSLTSLGTLSSLTVSGDLTVDTDTLFVDSTNNRVGIGTTPLAKLHILETTEQLRLAFDATKIVTFTVDSNGKLSIEPTGGTTEGDPRISTTGQWSSSVSKDGRNSGFFVESAIASIGLNSTTAPTNQRLFDIRSNGGIFRIAIRNNASNLDTVGMNIVTDGSISIGSVQFPEGTASFGFNTTTTSKMEIRDDSTDQLRLAFDTSNYTQFTVDETAFILSTASYDNISFDTSSQDSSPLSVAFNLDGTKMYVTGDSNDAVFQYTLTTGFDLTTASYDSVSFTISEDTIPDTIRFNSNGTKMYIVGLANITVYQYTLSTAFDLSTASYDSVSFLISEDTPTGLAFNSNGTKMYILGNSNQTVYQYTLSTGFDLSTASYDSISFSVASETTIPSSLDFNSDGTKMYVLSDSPTDEVFQYTLSTGFDLTTASYDSISFDTSSETTIPVGLVFNSDGTKMYIVDDFASDIFQYSIDAGGLTIAPTAGNTTFSSPKSDIISVLTTESLGTNAGTSSTFVGSQDPDGTITGAGGDIYIRDSGALSNIFFNKEATTGTNWQTTSLIPAEVNEIFSTAEYEDLGTGGIITTTGVRQLNLKSTVISATRHVISSQASELQFVDDTEANQVVYFGASNFITSTSGGDVTLRNADLTTFTAGIQLFDYAGEGKLPGVDIIEIVQSSNLAQWNLGSISRISTGEAGPIVFFRDSNIISSTDPLVVDTSISMAVNGCLFNALNELGSGGPLFSLKNTGYKEGGAIFNRNGGILYSGESLVRVDAGIPNDYNVEVINSIFILRSGASVFDTSGSTGTFTAVADNSISSTDITGVTDSSGVASFTHGGTTPPLGSLVTISGFIINTTYNTTGIVTASDTTTFEIDYIAFVADETSVGSFSVDGVTVTSTAHGLTIGTGVTLDTTLSTNYDGGFLIYNIQTNSFDVPATFTSITGALSAVTVVLGGSGYVNGESVTLTGTGSGATGTVSVSGGAVTAVNVIDAGTGYTSDETISIISALSGTGATGTAIITTPGTWSTEGLDQTDPRVKALNNPGIADSKDQAFGFTNANSTSTSITNGTYVAADVSTFTESDITERFKLIDATNGIFELTALEDFSGFISGSLSALKTGSTENYRFAMSTNGVAPTFATANYVPMEVKTTKVNIALQFLVELTKGDTIQIMVAGDGTSDALTITDLVIGIQ